MDEIMRWRRRADRRENWLCGTACLRCYHPIDNATGICEGCGEASEPADPIAVLGLPRDMFYGVVQPADYHRYVLP